MNKNTIYRYLGRYLATVLKVPFKNRQGKLMFYGDTNDRLRLKNVISDKNLKRYSNSVAARICLKHILDNYFIAVRPHSELESGYNLAGLQSPKAINKKMVDDQMKREAVTVHQGNRTETFNLPPLPTNHRRHYTKKLKAANEKIAQLEAKLRAKNAQGNPDSNASGVSSDTDGSAESTNPVSSDMGNDFSLASSDGNNQPSSENTVDESSNDEKPIQLGDSDGTNDNDNGLSGASDEPGYDNDASSNGDNSDEEQRDPKSKDDGFADGSWRE